MTDGGRREEQTDGRTDGKTDELSSLRLAPGMNILTSVVGELKLTVK
jgi:hypothetical protein